MRRVSILKIPELVHRLIRSNLYYQEAWQLALALSPTSLGTPLCSYFLIWKAISNI